MKTGVIVLLFSIFLLTGCSSAMLAYKTKGEPYQQLQERKRQEQTIFYNNQKYYCYSCDGTPSRTYTNAIGNNVVVYLYRVQLDFNTHCSVGYGSASCESGYSRCDMVEERFELKNNAVIDATVVNGFGRRLQVYSDACQGYTEIEN
ncbi:hypothetical protein [Serratia fonticola]|uniref:hypothetical protein n=1 Tax=Serratia fonticola TaxID=47917 RepID=UPI00093D13CF|nr:hypothetical protein [Serratia fonticola]OKP23825.1 hypothetical protein BSQ40_24315 [Serratia fonticola]